MCAAPSASGARSMPLLRPPAMSTTESKPDTAASVACGAVALESSYQLMPSASATSSTRWARPRKVVSARAHAVGRRAAGERGGGCGEGVGEVVGQAPEERRDLGDRGAVGADEAVAVDGVVGVARPTEPERADTGAGVDVAHDDRVVGVGDGDADLGIEVAPDAGLGLLVVLERRVDVQVISGEVQPRRDRRAEGPAVAEAERRRLHHEHVRGGIVDRGDQRHLGVAHRLGAQTGRFEHLGHQRRDRGLAVRAGDRQHRAVVPERGQIELAQDRDAGLACRCEHRVVVGQPRGGQHRGAVRDEVAPLLEIGCFEEIHGFRVCSSPARVRGMVVDRAHVAAVGPDRTGHRRAGHTEAHHQHRARHIGRRSGGQSTAPGMDT